MKFGGMVHVASPANESSYAGANRATGATGGATPGEASKCVKAWLPQMALIG